jgi:hypothetical protein
VNRTDAPLEGRIAVRGERPEQLEWLVPPADWDAGDGRLTVGARGVAAFVSRD